MVQRSGRFETDVVRHVDLEYLLYLPQGYGQAAKDWPLILFLHGAGERGHDLEKLKVHGIPKVVERETDFPFVALSPQCAEGRWWSTEAEVEALSALLDDFVGRHSVDESRIYLTGLSMGGYGSWALALTYPDRFAAVAPICGGLRGPAEQVCALSDVPVWAFHGAKDTVVRLEESQRLVDALEGCGGDVRFTIYPEAGHDSWTETYDNPALYEWFLSHSR